MDMGEKGPIWHHKIRADLNWRNATEIHNEREQHMVATIAASNLVGLNHKEKHEVPSFFVPLDPSQEYKLKMKHFHMQVIG